jgi:tRNA pseudouridine55 synthase
MHRFVGMEKEYTGEFELGIVTPSFDLETEVIERRPFSHLTRRHLEEGARAFVGRQLQKPPMYSATKHRGKPLYRYARRGRTVERPPKEIVVTAFDIVDVDIPHVRFRIVCSKGTYIRSLVHDLGQRLGCGATLTELRRTRIGEFSVDQAMTIEALENTAARIAARTA